MVGLAISRAAPRGLSMRRGPRVTFTDWVCREQWPLSWSVGITTWRRNAVGDELLSPKYSRRKSSNKESADVLPSTARQIPNSVWVLERILSIWSPALVLELDYLGYWILLNFYFFICKSGIIITVSPLHMNEWVLFWEHVCKSNLFISPINLA